MDRGATNMKIVLYSNDCPKCQVLKKKLIDKNLTFVTKNNMEAVVNLGYRTVPILVVDGEVMPFGDAVKWVNKQ